MPRASGRALLNGALVLLAVAALLVTANRDEDLGIEVQRGDPLPGIDELRVDVAGAVVQPGVVTVRPGDRVSDAVALAGGFTVDADRASLNLSRRVVDEDHIVVPRRGERSPLLDLNAASAKELEALPGIGPVYATAVLTARQTTPFTSSDDLVERGVLPARIYAQIRDLVTVAPR